MKLFRLLAKYLILISVCFNIYASQSSSASSQVSALFKQAQKGSAPAQKAKATTQNNLYKTEYLNNERQKRKLINLIDESIVQYEILVQDIGKAKRWARRVYVLASELKPYEKYIPKESFKNFKKILDQKSKKNARILIEAAQHSIFETIEAIDYDQLNTLGQKEPTKFEEIIRKYITQLTSKIQDIPKLKTKDQKIAWAQTTISLLIDSRMFEFDEMFDLKIKLHCYQKKIVLNAENDLLQKIEDFAFKAISALNDQLATETKKLTPPKDDSRLRNEGESPIHLLPSSPLMDWNKTAKEKNKLLFELADSFEKKSKPAFETITRLLKYYKDGDNTRFKEELIILNPLLVDLNNTLIAYIQAFNSFDEYLYHASSIDSTIAQQLIASLKPTSNRIETYLRTLIGLNLSAIATTLEYALRTFTQTKSMDEFAWQSYIYQTDEFAKVLSRGSLQFMLTKLSADFLKLLDEDFQTTVSLHTNFLKAVKNEIRAIKQADETFIDFQLSNARLLEMYTRASQRLEKINNGLVPIGITKPINLTRDRQEVRSLVISPIKLD